MDQRLWPLSYDEWTMIGNNTVRAYGNDFWLRSPDDSILNRAFVGAPGGVNGGTYDVSNTSVAVRPALSLNLSSVIFTSAAAGGKSDASGASDTLVSAAQPPTGAVKFTVKDDALNLDSVTPTGVSGRTVTFEYAGATANKTLSAVVTDISGEVRYYGKLLASTSANGTGVTITVPTDFAATDSLQIFVEELGISDAYTDFCSALVPMTIADQTAPTGIGNAGCTTAANNDGKITGTENTMEYSADGGTSWTACPNDDTENLAAGSYEVRYAGKVNGTTAHLASDAQTVTVDAYTPSGTVATPVANPSGGTVAAGTQVTLSCATSDATIHYTTDGNTPDSTSATYTTPITVNVAMTIKAFAVKGGMTDSAVMSESYTIKSDSPSYTDSGGSSYTQPAYSYGHITVYGVTVNYSVEISTGILTLSLTRSQLDSIIKAAGDDVTHIALNLTGVSGVIGIDVNFPPAWFAEHPGVTFPVRTSIGGVNLNNNAAAKFPAQDTTGTVSLRQGSVKLSARQDGKAVTWDSATAPVIVYVPYPLKADTNASTLVMYDKATGKTVPHSFYANGRVYGAVNRPGEYEVRTVAATFTDTESHWAKDDIAFAASHGLISGAAGTTFAPGMAITRADFLTALGKLSGADVSGYKTSGFTDVANDNSAMPYIEWAAANKIVTGTGGGKFSPGAAITREEMALMIVNYAKATGQILPATRQAIAFADAAKISDWAKDAVKAVQQANVITGKPGNLYDPKGSTTRAEAATILRRFAESAVSGRLGWVQTDKGDWQYIQSDYLPKTGWLSTTEGNKYYFDKDGLRVSGKWLQISGKWYYFYPNGKLAVSTTIDDYEIGADGARQ